MKRASSSFALVQTLTRGIIKRVEDRFLAMLPVALPHARLLARRGK